MCVLLLYLLDSVTIAIRGNERTSAVCVVGLWELLVLNLCICQYLTNSAVAGKCLLVRVFTSCSRAGF